MPPHHNKNNWNEIQRQTVRSFDELLLIIRIHRRWLLKKENIVCWKGKISQLCIHTWIKFFTSAVRLSTLQCTDAIFTFLLHFCQFCVQPCGWLNVSSLVLALCALCKNITRSILAWTAFFCILYLRLFICVKIYARCCVACIAYDKLDTGIKLMKNVCSYRRLWGVDIRARIG